MLASLASTQTFSFYASEFRKLVTTFKNPFKNNVSWTNTDKASTAPQIIEKKDARLKEDVTTNLHGNLIYKEIDTKL